MYVYGLIRGTLTAVGTLCGSLTASPTLGGHLTIPDTSAVPLYEGSYTFTPSGETQTISIANKTATQDITIEAIPSNYGLITWDGSALTVS